MQVERCRGVSVEPDTASPITVQQVTDSSLAGGRSTSFLTSVGLLIYNLSSGPAIVKNAATSLSDSQSSTLNSAIEKRVKVKHKPIWRY